MRGARIDKSLILGLGRAAIAALLVYALFVRILLPIVGPGVGDQFAEMHALCVTQLDDADRAPHSPASHSCGECCLGAIRFVFQAPEAPHAILVEYSVRPAIAPVWRLENEAKRDLTGLRQPDLVF